MFDPKSILDALVRGNAQHNPGASPGGGLDELLRTVLPDAGAPRRDDSTQSANLQPQEGAASASGNPLGDLLSQLQQQGGTGLSDMLGRLQAQASQPGGIADILGQVFGQATAGVREGAGRIDEATGASDRVRDAAGQLTGRSPEELMAQIKELIANNKLGAGAALGGLGALILGTGAGRSMAGSAIKLGGLALIGGLAYKAYQNYQQGLPPLTGAKAGAPQALLAAPDGSGFEAKATSNDDATLLLRAMIAAAAADGRVDAAEQKKILSGFAQGDLSAEARQFFAREFETPATVDELADACSSPEQGVKIYTAARLAVDVDTDQEHEFLTALAEKLGIDDALAEHIDVAARSAR
ncbi:MAG TPA: DUF533 domain-containing protein [Hyphomicrobiaceae bacterium]|nr:DUF533 domain-containing protein [Hyphomicrobiaceae bacterium]